MDGLRPVPEPRIVPSSNGVGFEERRTVSTQSRTGLSCLVPLGGYGKGQMIRVLVVEERRAVRDGLKRLLAAAGEITVVGETGGPGEAAEIAGRVDCDLALFGVGTADHEALEEVRRFTRSAPGLHVLLVGPSGDPNLAHEALAYGASGFLDIGRVREDLVKAVRLVCRGNVFSSAPGSATGGAAPGVPSSAKASRAGSSGRVRSASTAGAAGGTRPR
jgi:chemotaxis response regulator CheB